MSQIALKFIIAKEVKSCVSKPSFLSHPLIFLFLSFHILS